MLTGWPRHGQRNVRLFAEGYSPVGEEHRAIFHSSECELAL